MSAAHGLVDERERLILAHVPLLKHIVGRMIAPSGLDRDDLYGYGMLGLIEAADSWEPQRGLKFSTYAYTRIRGAILDEFRRADYLSRGRREQLRAVEKFVGATERARGSAPLPEEIAAALGFTCEEIDELFLAAKSGMEASLDEDVDACGTLGALLGDPTSPDPVGSAEWNEMKEELATAIAELPESEKSVIMLYY